MQERWEYAKLGLERTVKIAARNHWRRFYGCDLVLWKDKGGEVRGEGFVSITDSDAWIAKAWIDTDSCTKMEFVLGEEFNNLSQDQIEQIVSRLFMFVDKRLKFAQEQEFELVILDRRTKNSSGVSRVIKKEVLLKTLARLWEPGEAQIRFDLTAF